jgi:exopolysaccharide biosynthesis polyprenyl glycosylphosphotransferase
MTGVEAITNRHEHSTAERRAQSAMFSIPTLKPQTLTQKFLLVADLCLVWTSTGLAHLLIGSRGIMQSPVRQAFLVLAPLGYAFLFSVLVVLFADLRGLYEFPWKRNYREDLKRLADAIICAGIVTGTGACLGASGAGSIGTIILMMVFTGVFMGVWRKIVRSLSIPGLTEKRNVLIVGYGHFAHLLQEHLAANPQLGLIVKGFVSRRRVTRGNNPATDAVDTQLLGTVDELPAIARSNFIDEIIISLPSDRHLVKEITRQAQSAGVQVRVVPDLYDGLASERPVEYLGNFPTLTLSHRTIPTVSLIIKRLMDVILSGTALLVLSPVFAVAALIIKLDSEGPVFYGARRVGKKGVTFVCHKFRTMVKNADAMKKSLEHLNERDGILFKIAADPRVTRAGRYIRKFSIDELPQLWNVLKGDMSLVGPRPPACGEYTQYALEHLRRLDVMPGLTGLWQVTARKDPSFQNYVELDKEYVNNWTLGLDLRILCKTVSVVLAGTGQ